MKTSMLLAAATLALVNADEYFTGDGTAYTLGQPSAGNCNFMSALDLASTDYAALNDKQWDGLQNCGRCAEVSCDDDRCADKSKSIVVQILDRCPECQYGDLDLSPTVFTALTGSTPSRYTVKWKFVDCPVQGNVNYCLKGGSNNYWTAVQPTNVATGVKSLQINGQDTTMLSSAYYYLLDGASQTQTDLTSIKISLTDVNGNSIEDTVSLTADSCTEGAHQFSSSGGSSPAAQTTYTTPTPTTAAPTTAAPTQTPTPTTQTPAPTTQTPAPTTQTPAPTTQTPSPTTQSNVGSTTGSDASQTAQQGSSSYNVTGTVAPKSAPKPQKTTEAPETSTVTDAPSTQQKSGLPAATTATPSTNQKQTAASQGADDYTQSANTQSGDQNNGTDWTVIFLSAGAGVGAIALIAMVIYVKRKSIHEAKTPRDFEAPSMVSVQSFDMQNTPADRARNFGAQWDGLTHCGQCIEATCIDSKCKNKDAAVTLQVVDRCPECKYGDLDMSPAALTKIVGYNPGRIKIGWKYVDCPNPATIKFCLKKGTNPWWVAVQPTNTRIGVKGLTINGKLGKLLDDAYYYCIESKDEVSFDALKVSVTSMNGDVVSGTYSMTIDQCVDSKQQF
ncbi:hypothetical protein BBJ29_002660 [Phytophthora kernoviae]|uniref:Expansin-like EG45 domain-containing protein n=1 Tax=Phytophthora kernoviae TaxID=325452 RepID=A0A3F2RS12_9STRA|nr:hypothetical protein BBJ29_002660 [Phytophthora kernoviae]RLN63112.1 hypothetical protein BBP00_00004311 [Phytophthora kernoviae]